MRVVSFLLCILLVISMVFARPGPGMSMKPTEENFGSGAPAEEKSSKLPASSTVIPRSLTRNAKLTTTLVTKSTANSGTKSTTLATSLAPNSTANSTTSFPSNSSAIPRNSSMSTKIPITSITSPPTSTPPPQKVTSLPIKCFIDDTFKKEVQIIAVIGFRAEDEVFKISPPEETFQFSFFHANSIASLLNGPTTDAPDTTTIASNNTNSTNVFFSNATSFPIVPVPQNWTNFTAGGSVSSIPFNGIRASLDLRNHEIHFVTVPDLSYHHYQVPWTSATSRRYDESSLDRFKPNRKYTYSQKPLVCHFNVVKAATVCVTMKKGLVIINHHVRKISFPYRNEIPLPRYLSFDRFHSYADYQGNDFILLHHRGQWIYRIDYQEYLRIGQTFFKVFHLKTPGEDYEFMEFIHADQSGLVTQYRNQDGNYRYFYSLFSEFSGLKTYCIHDKLINGSIMVFARKRLEPQKGIAAKLRELLDTGDPNSGQFPYMQRILFYCTLLYLSIFITVQMVPVRKVRLSRELRRLEKEVQRLAPVIETIITKVHAFMELLKQQENTQVEKN